MGIPPALARFATSLDPNAGPVELEREARSATTEAPQHPMPTYDDMGAHPMPALMQGKLLDALLAELGEAERETAQADARTTDLRRPHTIQ